jgi:hypothetical protein
MRPFTNLFLINGKPMLAPDADVGVSYTDLDADDSGRDEAGYMHRIVMRYKVGTWSFEYASITEAEKRYLEELFGDSPDFEFTRPDRLNAEKQVTVKAYRSKYSNAWHNARTGQWRNYKFNIIEC